MGTMRLIAACIVMMLAAGRMMSAQAPLDPANFGAVGDGKADDTRAIQSALNAAAKGPKVVVLRPGVYRITATLDVPASVTLSGAMARWEDGSTTITIEKNGFSAVRLNNVSNARALTFSYPNNRKGDDPDEYPPTILLVGVNPSVEQVRFDSAWIGVAPPPEGANTGQALFRDITGFTHKIGVRLDGIRDIARIEDVHWFVPPYKASFFRRERVGFEFGAVDGIIMSRCFMIGGKAFFHQRATNGKGQKVHSLGHHITQCWTESVKYGFLIEGTCGLVLSDTQIYVSDPKGAGIAMRMPRLYYHSTISNTQIRCDRSHAVGIEYNPTADHPRNHLMVSHCDIQESSPGVRLGPLARRVWITENLIQSYSNGIEIERGAATFIIKNNIIRAKKQPIKDESEEKAVKLVDENLGG